jgi:hypothetical protein
MLRQGAADLDRIAGAEPGGESDGTASCSDPDHPVWLRNSGDQRTCPWCHISGLETALVESNMKLGKATADAAVDLPALRASLTEWSTRCRAEVETARSLRIRIAELEALTSGRPVTMWFLAEYEGVEGPPTLHATQQSAQAWCDELAADFGDGPWDWFPRSDEPDAGWQQWRTDPDSDRPVTEGSGSVLPLTVQGGAR